MKKYLVLMLVLILALSLAVGCSTGAKTEQSTLAVTEASVEVAQETDVVEVENESEEVVEEVAVESVPNLDNRFVVTSLKMDGDQLVMDFQSIVEKSDVIERLTATLTAGEPDTEAKLERFPDLSIERTEGEVITNYMVWMEDSISYVAYDNSVYKLNAEATKALSEVIESVK